MSSVDFEQVELSLMLKKRVNQILYLFEGLIVVKTIVQVEAFMQIIRHFEERISFKVLAGGFFITICLKMLMRASQKSQQNVPA
jgi:uncharacterized membrane protein